MVPDLKALTLGAFPTQKHRGKGHKCSLVDHRATQVRRRVPQTKEGETLAPEDIQWAPTTGDLRPRVHRVIQDLHIITHNRLWQCRPWLIGKHTSPLAFPHNTHLSQAPNDVWPSSPSRTPQAVREV